VTEYLDRWRRRSVVAPDRLPPGQVETTKWPVLHYGAVPQVDPRGWTFDIAGLVERPFTLSYDEFLELPRETAHADIHCVTRWSRFDNVFEGVAVSALLRRAGVQPAARYCLVRAEQGFTTNLSLADLDRPGNLVALKWGGEWLAPEHGWPARLLVPHLYFWKSAKWLRGLTLLDEDVPGFWEQNGYHMHGDPWKEERYGGRGLTQHDINRLRNLSKQGAQPARAPNNS
jgi:DMSO/TMAO reductase YedYZ molybdopterin-dependent catalytic subunit